MNENHYYLRFVSTRNQSARIPPDLNNENHSQLDGIFRHPGQHRRRDKARQCVGVYLAACCIYAALQAHCG